MGLFWTYDKNIYQQQRRTQAKSGVEEWRRSDKTPIDFTGFKSETYAMQYYRRFKNSLSLYN